MARIPRPARAAGAREGGTAWRNSTRGAQHGSARRRFGGPDESFTRVFPYYHRNGGYMRRLSPPLLAVVLLIGSCVPASADITAFLGATTTPTNRQTHGLAAGAGLLIVAFE